MSTVLTVEQVLKLVGEVSVYHMSFNHMLGMELGRYKREFAQLTFKGQSTMMGN